MTKQLWIWKNRLTVVLTTISAEINVEMPSSSLDEIKYGLLGTSDEKDNWFDYRLGDITLKLALDNDDNDIVHFQIDGLDDKSIDGLSAIVTKK